MDDYSLGDYQHPEIRKMWTESMNQGIANLKKNMEQQLNERRLTMNADGTTSGGFIKKQDQEKVVIGNAASVGVVGGVLHSPVKDALSDYLAATQATPLTAEQRISELKKKINEYKSLLNVVTDTAAKLFFNQLLINIEKDLGEILVEVKKKPAQQPVVISPTPVPYYPSPPFIGQYDAMMQDSYTVCAGKTCVTYGKDGSVSATTQGGLLSNSNEENQ